MQPRRCRTSSTWSWGRAASAWCAGSSPPSARDVADLCRTARRADRARRPAARVSTRALDDGEVEALREERRRGAGAARVSERRIVTVDGPAGSGKSTLGRALALELGLPLIDTGLFYRGIMVAAVRAGLDAARPRRARRAGPAHHRRARHRSALRRRQRPRRRRRQWPAAPRSRATPACSATISQHTRGARRGAAAAARPGRQRGGRGGPRLRHRRLPATRR